MVLNTLKEGKKACLSLFVEAIRVQTPVQFVARVHTLIFICVHGLKVLPVDVDRLGEIDSEVDNHFHITRLRSYSEPHFRPGTKTQTE